MFDYKSAMNNQTFHNEFARKLDGAFHVPSDEEANLHQLLFEDNPLPAFIFNVETLELTAVNNSATREYGYSRREFLAMKIKDIYPANGFNEIKSDDKTSSSIEKHRKKDGAMIEVKVSARSFTDEGRRFRLMLVQEIAASAARTLPVCDNNFLGALMDSLPDPIYFKDTDLRFIKINKWQAATLGIDNPEDAVGKSDFDFYNSETAQNLFEEEQRIIASKQPRIGRVQKTVNTDGEYRRVTATKVPVINDDGEVIGLAAISRDITDLKRIKAESTVISKIIHGVSTTSNLEDLLALIHQAIGKILYAGNCFVALYDQKTELLHMQFFVDKYDAAPPPVKLGRGLSAYIFRNERPMLMTPAIMDQLTASGEVDFIGTQPAVWMGVPLRTPNGVIGVMVVQHYEDENAYTQRDLDILTSVGDQIALAIERKQAEEQLILFNNRLQQSNRELQEFAYVASHDLQEPLRKVQAFSDRLVRKYGEKLEGEGLDYLERMRNASSRMQTLIQDLLTFSRVATKTQPFEPVNLDTVTREVLSDLEVKIEETGATIEIIDLPAIDADALQMRQLIQNMIGNALKFRRADTKPQIKIYAETLPAGKNNNQTCQLFIEDNGIGFDEKYIGKIFTVFQRLHGRSEYEGSGVGLAVCRKIVERHNGQIDARSKPGDGATFIITLPFKQINTEVNR